MIKKQVITDDYALYNGDNMEVMPQFPDNTIGLHVCSPPFANESGGLYNYSSSDRDLSNCKDMEDFFQHYDFMIKEQHRILMTGRISAVHCMDVPSGNSGKDHMWDFPGYIIQQHCKCRKDNCTDSEFRRSRGLCNHGLFEFIGRYSIWKEPLGVRNRTMAKNLAHKTIVDDSSLCSLASADYLLIFRKKGTNPKPIKHETGLHEYYGFKEMPEENKRYQGYKGDQKKNKFSHWIWRQYASAFWDDIRIANVLEYEEAREKEDEKHVHPLQLDVIARCVQLWSNPNDIVFTPFMGVGSEVYQAVYMNRKGIGVELKESYYNQAVKNVKKAFDTKPCQLSLGLEI